MGPTPISVIAKDIARPLFVVKYEFNAYEKADNVIDVPNAV